MNCTGKRCIMQHDKVDPATCKCVSFCPQATPPKTNADRIRSMTDEELAELFEMIPHSKNPAIYIDGVCIDDGLKTKREWLDWLKQEADG